MITNNKNSSSLEAAIMQTVDYDLWLTEREIRGKNAMEICYDFSYDKTENTSSVPHLEGLLEPREYIIKEVTGYFNNKRMKKRFILHKDYDIMSLIQARQVIGAEFLDDSGQSLFFILILR